MKTIKLYQAKGLIYQQNIDDLFCIDRVSSDDYTEVIFKKGSNNQLYSFYCYYYNDGSNLGLATNTTKQFDVFLDDTNNKNLDVDVAPVKRATKQIAVTKYVGAEKWLNIESLPLKRWKTEGDPVKVKPSSLEVERCRKNLRNIKSIWKDWKHD